jgi:3-hydroxyisobutyrate dehydrogenase-like beta-hydroxyacid dehydrogenase
MMEAMAEIRRLGESAGLRGIPVHVITTITPETARRLPEHASAALRIIENPITGGEAPALLGTQTAMLAGDYNEADIDFLRDGLMEEVVTFDAYGEPALAKLLNNLTCAYNLAAFGAVMELAERAGLNARKLGQVLNHGSGESYAGRMVVSMMGDLLAKDVDLAKTAVGQPPLVDPDGIEAQLAETRARLSRA